MIECRDRNLQFNLFFQSQLETTPLIWITLKSFVLINNFIQRDEKWFHLSSKKSNVYFNSNETAPNRTTNRKNYSKEMFYVESHNMNTIIPKSRVLMINGIWPFVKFVLAQCNFWNGRAQTLEMRLLAVAKDAYSKYFTENVLIKIKEPFPRTSKGRVFIQQESARLHISMNYMELVQKEPKFWMEYAMNLSTSKLLGL